MTRLILVAKIPGVKDGVAMLPYAPHPHPTPSTKLLSFHYWGRGYNHFNHNYVYLGSPECIFESLSQCIRIISRWANLFPCLGGWTKLRQNLYLCLLLKFEEIEQTRSVTWHESLMHGLVHGLDTCNTGV